MFRYLITVEPLGLLYGSAGRFLSTDNLVGRSGDSFPPKAMALAGLFAHALSKDPQKQEKLENLVVAGAFWAYNQNCQTIQNFYVPTPQTYLVDKETKQVSDRLVWQGEKWRQFKWQVEEQQRSKWVEVPEDKAGGKFESGSWQSIQEWNSLEPPEIKKSPWKSLPHLHPKLCADERRTYIDEETGKGGLFLENAVQLHPDVCLVYLSTEKLDDGWYRFGGEGHMVEVNCHELDSETIERFNQPVGKSFTLITPAVWGSNNFSYREPGQQVNDTWQDAWEVETMLIDRPHPFRYRRGGYLSRGRYAVPAGTVYVLEKEEKPWSEWPEDWFPSDRDEPRKRDDLSDQDKPTLSKNENPKTFKKLTLKNWGCGLALPLTVSKEDFRNF